MLPANEFPKLPPKSIPAWVWERFLKAVRYRESVLERREGATSKTPYWHFLGHELKRSEIDIGLWIGRMMEIEQETKDAA